MLNTLISDIVKVWAGGYISLFLKNTNQLYGAGYSTYGSLCLGSDLGTIQSPTLIMANVKDVSTGTLHTLIQKLDGSLVSCGNGFNGRLGINSTENQLGPVQVPIPEPISKFYAGNSHSVVVTTNNKVYSFGQNDRAQLSLGYINPNVLTPTFAETSYQYPAIDVACGYSATFFISPSGQAFSYGFLGFDWEPSQIHGFSGINVQVSAGFTHILTLSDSGRVWVTGSGSSGQTGMGNTDTIDIPAMIPNLGNITAVEASQQSSYFVNNQGSVFVTGGNSYGQLGLNDTTMRTVPTVNPYLFNITKMSSTSQHALFLDTSGRVWSVGYNYAGLLGLGDTLDRRVPELVVMVSTLITQVFAGSFHSLFLAQNGTVLGSGYASDGRLCFLDGFSRHVPQIIPNLNITTQISCNYANCYYMNTQSEVWGCGWNSNYELGQGDTVSRKIPVKIHGLSNVSQVVGGYYHTLFLTNSKQVYVIGKNDYGELGLADKITRTIPTLLEGVNNTIGMAASQYFSVLLGSCPDGLSGPQCQYPLCYGLSANNIAYVCSGQGVCTGIDKCECFAPSFGSRCEFNQYVWKGFGSSGLWSNPNNWYVKRGDQLLNSVQVPLLNGDSVFIGQPGNYSITVDVSDLSLTSLTIGSSPSFPIVILKNVNLKLMFLDITPTGTLKSIDSKISIDTSNIQGATEWTGCQISGNLTSSASILLNSGEFVNTFLENSNILVQSLSK